MYIVVYVLLPIHAMSLLLPLYVNHPTSTHTFPDGIIETLILVLGVLSGKIVLNTCVEAHVMFASQSTWLRLRSTVVQSKVATDF